MDLTLTTADNKRIFRVRAIPERDVHGDVTSWQAVVEVTSNVGGGRSIRVGSHRSREHALAAADRMRKIEMDLYEVGL